MLTCKQNEHTNYPRKWTRDLGPVYIDSLHVRVGCELAVEAAMHFCAVQYANGVTSISESKLRDQVHDFLAAICAVNLADGTIHYSDEAKARPKVNL